MPYHVPPTIHLWSDSRRTPYCLGTLKCSDGASKPSEPNHIPWTRTRKHHLRRFSWIIRVLFLFLLFPPDHNQLSYTRTVVWWWWWCDSFRLPLIYTAVSVSAAAAAAVDKTIPRAFATSSAHAWSMNACNNAILYLVRIIPTYLPIY